MGTAACCIWLSCSCREVEGSDMAGEPGAWIQMFSKPMITAGRNQNR
jgi:hypothetical protein